MIICDLCSMPTKEATCRPTQDDPLAETHWCPDCTSAYNRIFSEEKSGYMQEVADRTAARFDAWLKDRFK